MKPSARVCTPVGNLLQNFGFGLKNTAGSIKGSTKKLGGQYSNATICLYSKDNLALIGIRRPDSNGNYKFLGLNNSLNCFIVGFDNEKRYNAVIQDGVVPK